MKYVMLFYFFIFQIGIFAQKQNEELIDLDNKINLNNNWLFFKDDIPKAYQVNYDDRKWRSVDLPHDWSIEDLPNQRLDTIVGPFSRYSIGKASTGWTVGGTGWYRKKFITRKEWHNKLISIHFEGIYMNSDVWLNGYHLGNHPYGYTPFYYDLTPYLNSPGQENILAVRVRNEGKNSRWYTGSGIYRDVSLNITNPVYVDKWGIMITTPEISEDSSTIKILTTINNTDSSLNNIRITTKILSSGGENVGIAYDDLMLEAKKSKKINQSITVIKPELWSLESPVLYNLVSEIQIKNEIIDRVVTSFGIRSISFDSENGFTLNGKPVLLKGGCLHHDNGPLGSAAFTRAEERKVELLKKNGFNAIRSSHNPASKHLLDACDRLGMLVIDEAFDTWVRPKNKNNQDYSAHFNQWWQSDLHAMIKSHRNHPSVIMWSIGNEIYEAPDLLGQDLARMLADEVRMLDPTRPVTEAFVFLPPFTRQPWEEYEKHLTYIDIDGYNYFLVENSIHFVRDSAILHRFESEHKKHPDKVFYASESFASSALENWNKVEEHPYMLGCFKWTTIDYIGEAGLGESRLRPKNRPIPSGVPGMGLFFKEEWPLYASSCGDLDIIGNKTQASYYQDVVWRISPIEMLVHTPIPADKKEAIAPWGFPDELKSWTWPGEENKKIQVDVYSRCESVKLELNGKIVAEQLVPIGSITTTFNIDYIPGTLVAKGFTKGVHACSDTLLTTGKPVAIRLIAERNKVKADKAELAYINVEIIDEKGNVVPNINNLEIDYEISGNASLAAVGNGNVWDMSSFQQPRKKVYQGRGLVILRSNGKKGDVSLSATAEGLKDGHVKIILE